MQVSMGGSVEDVKMRHEVEEGIVNGGDGGQKGYGGPRRWCGGRGDEKRIEGNGGSVGSTFGSTNAALMIRSLRLGVMHVRLRGVALA